jgi:uncharacterized protein with FMN-binding domain
MKRTVVSAFIVFGFVLYAVGQRSGDSGQSPVAAAPAVPAAPVPTGSVPVDPQPSPSPSSGSAGGTGALRDGEYIGDSVDAFYGYVQVKAVIRGGKISDVQFLSYPSDRNRSVAINSQAMPLLTSEAISSQTAQVDVVTGATATSQAFVRSLSTALAKAG